jgi:hypothetical protein
MKIMTNFHILNSLRKFKITYLKKVRFLNNLNNIGNRDNFLKKSVFKNPKYFLVTKQFLETHVLKIAKVFAVKKNRMNFKRIIPKILIIVGKVLTVKVAIMQILIQIIIIEGILEQKKNKDQLL